MVKDIIYDLILPDMECKNYLCPVQDNTKSIYQEIIKVEQHFSKRLSKYN